MYSALVSYFGVVASDVPLVIPVRLSNGDSVVFLRLQYTNSYLRSVLYCNRIGAVLNCDFDVVVVVLLLFFSLVSLH